MIIIFRRIKLISFHQFWRQSIFFKMQVALCELINHVKFNLFSGLKVMIICFPHFLSSEWRTMASVLKEVVMHGAGKGSFNNNHQNWILF